jgi:hypothetical protein
MILLDDSRRLREWEMGTGLGHSLVCVRDVCERRLAGRENALCGTGLKWLFAPRLTFWLRLTKFENVPSS